jgi:hypothetical protein
VPRGRHSLEPTTIRRRRLAFVTAPLVTLLAVGLGITTSGFGQPDAPTAASGHVSAAAPSSSDAPQDGERTLGTSRSAGRAPLVDHRVPKAKGKLWTTGDLDLRVTPREKSKTVGLVKSDKQVAVTGRREGAFAEVLLGEEARWVTAEYLSKKKEKPEPEEAGTSDQPCPDGSEIESAIQPAAVKVYRSVCAAFPELTTYGGQDGHGEHVNGQAIDFMVPSSDVGQRLADYLYANHAKFDLFDIIWSQNIWTIERAGEGFRPMEDRGSPTANHFDHVHIMVN